MARSYQGAGAPAGKLGHYRRVAAAGGSAFLTSLVFGPEAGVADALLEGGKDAFQSATEQTLKVGMAGHRGLEPERRRGTQ